MFSIWRHLLLNVISRSHFDVSVDRNFTSHWRHFDVIFDQNFDTFAVISTVLFDPIWRSWWCYFWRRFWRALVASPCRTLWPPFWCALCRALCRSPCRSLWHALCCVFYCTLWRVLSTAHANNNYFYRNDNGYSFILGWQVSVLYKLAPWWCEAVWRQRSCQPKANRFVTLANFCTSYEFSPEESFKHKIQNIKMQSKNIDKYLKNLGKPDHAFSRNIF